MIMRRIRRCGIISRHGAAARGGHARDVGFSRHRDYVLWRDVPAYTLYRFEYPAAFVSASITWT